jgi:hypothetical protein
MTAPILDESDLDAPPAGESRPFRVVTRDVPPTAESRLQVITRLIDMSFDGSFAAIEGRFLLDQFHLVTEERDLLRLNVKRLSHGVCPTCHTKEGHQSLTRSAGYLGEFTVPADCQDPFHVASPATIIK